MYSPLILGNGRDEEDTMLYRYTLRRFSPETDELSEEVELLIEADYYPASPGSRYEPPSGPWMEIYDVRRADTGETFRLTEEEEEEISEALLEQADAPHQKARAHFLAAYLYDRVVGR